MKEISLADKVCKNCGHFTQYYTQANYHNLEEIGFGLCEIKNQTVKEKEACESFCLQKKPRLTAEEIDAAVIVIKDLKELLL